MSNYKNNMSNVNRIKVKFKKKNNSYISAY